MAVVKEKEKHTMFQACSCTIQYWDLDFFQCRAHVEQYCEWGCKLVIYVDELVKMRLLMCWHCLEINVPGHSVTMFHFDKSGGYINTQCYYPCTLSLQVQTAFFHLNSKFSVGNMLWKGKLLGGKDMNGGFMKDSKLKDSEEESGNRSKRSKTEMKEKHLHMIEKR